jgi:hypothetical protein
MALIPRRNPLTSLLNFAADRDREANSLGSVITQLAGPALGQMGVQTEETAQPAVMRGPVPMAQPLGAFTGPAMAPTLVDQPVSDDFMRRLVKQESGGNPNAVSPKGATGLTQVMPSTAVDPGYGVPSIFDLADEQGVDYSARTQDEAARLLFDPDLNYQFGNLYANAMSKRFGGDPALTAAAYNAGPGAVEQYGGVPPWEETQNYVNAVAGGGGDARLGGGAGADTLGGNSVEALLAQLYPQMTPEEEKRQRRNDFFSAASQGLTALGQGRPVDFSNIRAEQDARKRQAVLDMRERERARSAAALVFSQTGDRDLAAGIATGAINYGDVVSERERKRVEAEADRQRVSAEQASGRLSGIVESMWSDLGLPDSVKESVLAGIAAGDDPNTIFTLTEQAKVAEAARVADEAEAETASMRAAAIESFSTSGNPIEQYAGRLLALDPTLTVDTALTRSSELVGPPKDFVPSDATKTWNAGLETARSQGPEAEAAYLQQFPNAAVFDLARSGKLGGGVTTVDAMNADLIAKGLMVTPDPANPTQPLMRDGQVVTSEIQGGPAQQDRLAREQTAAEAAAKQGVLDEKETLRGEQEVVRNNSTMRLLSDVYDQSQGFVSGAIPGFVRGQVAQYFGASDAGKAKGQLEGVQVNIFTQELAAMRESSPTGAAVGNVTEGERAALASAYGKLDVGGDPAVLQQNLRAIANAALDLQYGTPAALKKAVEDGTLDAETAERYGARYDIDGTAETGMNGDLGPVMPLGVAAVDENVLAAAEIVDGVAPDSPDPAFESQLIQNPEIITNMSLDDYKNLSPEQKAVFDRLAEGDN